VKADLQMVGKGLYCGIIGLGTTINFVIVDMPDSIPPDFIRPFPPLGKPFSARMLKDCFWQVELGVNPIEVLGCIRTDFFELFVKSARISCDYNINR